MMRLRSEGKSLTEIAAHLNNHKVKPRKAKSWDHSIVRSIIQRQQATTKGDHHA
ncbi:MAG: recombinase family protein [Bdellovibrionaceae bacterium]|nr:recombinase family protein [Pseudobdellovibrionaceae bacterium]